MRQTIRPGRMTLVSIACGALLSACGGGGGEQGKLQAISFEYPATTLGVPPSTMRATSTSGLPVSFASGTPDVCAVTGNQLKALKLGECQVIASQPGGTSADGQQWAPAEDVYQVFNVTKGGQTIGIVGPEYVQSATTQTVTLSTFTSAGDAATLSGGTPGVCTLNGNTLTILGKGSCAVTATHPGNDTYLPATVTAFIGIDPLIVAEGITGAGQGTTKSAKTNQNGAVTVNPWSSAIGGWESCGNTDNTCFRSVSPDGRTFTSSLHIPTSKYTPGNWEYSFNNIEIFGPGLSGFNNSGDTVDGVQVTTETTFAMSLGVNEGLYKSGKAITVNLDLGKRSNNCNPTLEATLMPTVSGVNGYAIPFAGFKVTQACGLSGDAVALIKGSNVVRVRVRLPSVNTTTLDRWGGTYYGSDLSIVGSIRLQ